MSQSQTTEEWEKDFNSRFDYSLIESVIRDMDDQATWIEMKKNILSFIRETREEAHQSGLQEGRREKDLNDWKVRECRDFLLHVHEFNNELRLKYICAVLYSEKIVDREEFLKALSQDKQEESHE